MSVTTVTYWKGGKPEQIVPAAKQAKAILIKHGAQHVELNKVYAGPDTGQWAVVVNFGNWNAYGKSQQALLEDAEYQTLLARVGEISEMTSRRIVVSVDL
jgi:hypothetical protein